MKMGFRALLSGLIGKVSIGVFNIQALIAAGLLFAIPQAVLAVE